MFEENKEICRRLMEEAYGKGNLKTVDDSVSPKCRLRDPVFPSLAPGVDNLKKHIRDLRTAFPDLTCSCDDIIAEGHEVVIHWTCRGTQRAEFLSHPATNRTATVSGTTIHRMENGKIAEMWSDWNLQSLLEQLGIGMSEGEGNKNIVRRFVEDVWNRKKLDSIGQLLSAEAVLHSPTGTHRGVTGFRQECENFITGFPDCHLQIEDLISEGDRVVMRGTMTGTHSGKFQEMAPSGKPVKLQGTAVFRTAQGKIAEQNVIYDRLAMLQQIGAVPETATAARGRR